MSDCGPSARRGAFRSYGPPYGRRDGRYLPGHCGVPTTRGVEMRISTVLCFLSIVCVQSRVTVADEIGWKQGAVLWRDPGAVERLDLAAGPGRRAMTPKPPFVFVKDLDTGTSPKVRVRDANRREWVAKWGAEVKAENFASRLVWACGYFVEPTYFVREGVIRGHPGKGKSRSYVAADGRFQDARFQLWDSHLLEKHDWSWSYNPFLGTRELNGLKILVMLTSNWDDKDARNVDLGSNTAIQEYIGPGGKKEYRYLITDWGGTMGKVGLPLVHNKWDCDGYSGQDSEFVTGIKGGMVQWGFSGTNNEVKQGISVQDIGWLLRYLGRITDSQLRGALRASGATPTETECFTVAVRRRITILRGAAGNAACRVSFRTRVAAIASATFATPMSCLTTDPSRVVDDFPTWGGRAATQQRLTAEAPSTQRTIILRKTGGTLEIRPAAHEGPVPGSSVRRGGDSTRPQRRRRQLRSSVLA
jgi:hypothetical protein